MSESWSLSREKELKPGVEDRSNGVVALLKSRRQKQEETKLQEENKRNAANNTANVKDRSKWRWSRGERMREMQPTTSKSRR